jgi:hypothetical protein
VKTKNRNTWLTTLLATICLLVACERQAYVTLEGGVTPVFVLSGSGQLASLAVYSPDFAAKAESPWDENFALWKIKPIGDNSTGTPLRKLRRITYGVLPDGYEQVKPTVGSAPPLAEGLKYFYEVETTSAPGTAGFVEIRNSRAVATHGLGPCFQADGKKWIRVACPN